MSIFVKAVIAKK